MNDITPRKIKTGGDPRTLPDYAALRDELSKLTHPARPDVNWHYVEKLSLSLFEQNGVELQTAAWYTLARTQLAGLFGLNEGLTILEALINHQWGTLWPQPVHARMEILSSLSQRLQQRMRRLTFNYSDLSQLYRAEQHLINLRAKLERLELKQVNQFTTLQVMLHNSTARLKNSKVASDSDAPLQPDTSLPAAATDGAERPDDAPLDTPVAEENESAHIIRRVYIAQPQHQANIEVVSRIPAPFKKAKVFIAGMGTMLALGGIVLWCWQKIYPSPANPLPVIADIASLKTLEQLPPLWRQDYGFALAARAAPGEAEKLHEQWLQYISGNVLAEDSLSGWHQGMEGLQDLTRRLNALDERKGKYLTGSELKSMVFAITQDFTRGMPVEEQLYQMSQAREPLPETLLLQTDIRLNQLLNRYMLIRMASPAEIELIVILLI